MQEVRSRRVTDFVFSVLDVDAVMSRYILSFPIHCCVVCACNPIRDTAAGSRSSLTRQNYCHFLSLMPLSVHRVCSAFTLPYLAQITGAIISRHARSQAGIDVGCCGRRAFALAMLYIIPRLPFD